LQLKIVFGGRESSPLSEVSKLARDDEQGQYEEEEGDEH